MSKYVMNKFMRAVEMSDAEVAAYAENPAAYVDRWIHSAPSSALWGDDRTLSREERQAFAARDYEALYALGAHPYLLWHFTEAVYIHKTHEATWPELVERYRDAVSRHDPPDYLV